MPNYIRAFVPGGTFFFTVTLLERQRCLLTEYINDLRKVFYDVIQRYPFTIDAVVVLPDHIHCIWTLPANDSYFSKRWYAIKSRFSAKIPKGERLSERRIKKGERGIWQRRFWEHVIRDEMDLERHIDYIHYNPVKHSHVINVIDWPYSSFHKYMRNGIYPPNWVANDNVKNYEME
ncbi:transposase [Achromatium sp. WMS1]|nr:transposase [Achromatium sp. WMS1]